MHFLIFVGLSLESASDVAADASHQSVGWWLEKLDQAKGAAYGPACEHVVEC